MTTPQGTTEFEELLSSLEDLTREEIAKRVTACISMQDALSFEVLAAGLSIEALRFVSARTLLRQPPVTASANDAAGRR